MTVENLRELRQQVEDRIKEIEKQRQNYLDTINSSEGTVEQKEAEDCEIILGELKRYRNDILELESSIKREIRELKEEKKSLKEYAKKLLEKANIPTDEVWRISWTYMREEFVENELSAFEQILGEAEK